MEASRPARNRYVHIAVPKAGNEKLKNIFACHYSWATGATTKRVVTAADAAILEAETRAQVKDSMSGKVTQMQRFTCLIGAETDEPAAQKNEHIGPARLDFPKNPQVEETRSLKEAVAELVKSNVIMADAFKTFAGRINVNPK